MVAELETQLSLEVLSHTSLEPMEVGHISKEHGARLKG